MSGYDLPDDLPDWCREMLAHWQACGPWVPDESLTDEGQRIKQAFLWMLASDSRYKPQEVKS